ncbi:hypothetical protein FG87_22125 [Nocardia vulneris]|uniref:Uncharacterized protein n=1 Tax=Nocardia vulneris TaxID=1141657 RepID=A0ABR4ZCL7_9NOCA|nr:hypothetical protein FG87_22125 [Nocardia vulneris]
MCYWQENPAQHPYRVEDSRILGYSSGYFDVEVRNMDRRPASPAPRHRGIARGREDPFGVALQRVASGSWRDFTANEILV